MFFLHVTAAATSGGVPTPFVAKEHAATNKQNYMSKVFYYVQYSCLTVNLDFCFQLSFHLILVN